MLSRTAGELYWMARYIERVENTARLLDMATQLAMLPREKVTQEELQSVLDITGASQHFNAQGGTLALAQVFSYLSVDLSHSNSIASALSYARDNARSVRGKISTEIWQVINSSWLGLVPLIKQKSTQDINQFLDWIKERGHLFRGAMYGSSTRNEAYAFMRLGMAVERGIHTTRVLSHRFAHIDHTLAEEVSEDLHGENLVRLHALLRSFGAYEAYQEKYGDKLSYRNIAELMILDPRVPRSIESCLAEMDRILQQMEGHQSQNVRRMTAVQYARVHYADPAHIFEERGIYTYLADLLHRFNTIAESIHSAYLEVI